MTKTSLPPSPPRRPSGSVRTQPRERASRWKSSRRSGGGGTPPELDDLFVKYLQLFGVDEYGFVLGQLQLAKPFLRQLNVNRSSPLGERFDFDQRAGRIDVFDGRAKV